MTNRRIDHAHESIQMFQLLGISPIEINRLPQYISFASLVWTTGSIRCSPFFDLGLFLKKYNQTVIIKYYPHFIITSTIIKTRLLGTSMLMLSTFFLTSPHHHDISSSSPSCSTVTSSLIFMRSDFSLQACNKASCGNIYCGTTIILHSEIANAHFGTSSG